MPQETLLRAAPQGAPSSAAPAVAAAAAYAAAAAVAESARGARSGTRSTEEVLRQVIVDAEAAQLPATPSLEDGRDELLSALQIYRAQQTKLVQPALQAAHEASASFNERYRNATSCLASAEGGMAPQPIATSSALPHAAPAAGGAPDRLERGKT